MKSDFSAESDFHRVIGSFLCKTEGKHQRTPQLLPVMVEDFALKLIGQRLMIPCRWGWCEAGIGAVLAAQWVLYTQVCDVLPLSTAMLLPGSWAVAWSWPSRGPMVVPCWSISKGCSSAECCQCPWNRFCFPFTTFLHRLQAH